MAAACNGAGSTPTPTQTQTAVAQAPATATQPPTPPPSPTAASQPEPPANPFVGLWSGVADDGSDSLGLAFAIIPGADPDTDPWIFRGGVPGADGSLGPQISCQPEPIEGGWLLAACAGLSAGLDFRAVATLSPPALEISVNSSLVGPPYTATLTRATPLAEPASSDNVELVWRFQGPGGDIFTDVLVSDGAVFAPSYADQVYILDAHTGQQVGIARPPSDILSSPGGSRVLDVRVSGGHLFAATETHGLLVFDVTDLSRPAFVGQEFAFLGLEFPDNFYNVHNIQLSPDGNTLYAINSSIPTPDLRIFDVSSPGVLLPVGRFSLPSEDFLETFHDLHLTERGGSLIAFVNSGTRGFLVLDVSDPTAIALLADVRRAGGYSHSGWAYEQGGSHFYVHTEEGVSRGMTIFAVDDLTNPVEIGSFTLRQGTSIHNVQVRDGIAYVAHYLDGLRLFDLSDPAFPLQIAHYDTVDTERESYLFQGAWGVALGEDLVYISDMQGGIFAFRVELPSP